MSKSNLSLVWSEPSALQHIKFLSIFWVLFVLTILLVYPPEWALMDDVGIQQLASRHFDGKTFWQYFFETIRGDFGWGMFRPVYVIFSYVFYGLFYKSSHAAYLFLYLVAICLFRLWSRFFSQCAVCFESNPSRIKIYELLFFICCFLFVPHHSLFFFGSLQERLILCFGAIGFWAMVEMNRINRFSIKSAVALALGVLLSLLSKATAIFLIPPFILWLCGLGISNKKHRKSFISLVILLAIVGLGFGYLFLHIRTGYTSGYQIDSWNHLLNVITPRARALLSQGIFCFLVLLVAWQIVPASRNMNRLFAYLIWPLGLISYLVVFIPWGKSAGYYFIPAGVFLIGSILCVHQTIFSRKNTLIFNLSITGFILLALIGTVSSAKKLFKEARQHYGLREVVKFLDFEFTRSDRPVMIRMPEPCLEASFHMNSLLNRPNSVFMLKDAHDSFLIESEKNVRKLLITNKECKSVPKAVQVQTVLFQSWPWYVYEVQATKP